MSIVEVRGSASEAVPDFLYWAKILPCIVNRPFERHGRLGQYPRYVGAYFGLPSLLDVAILLSWQTSHSFLHGQPGKTCG